MILTNYHSHSHYCDGKGSLEDQVQGAIAQGLIAFGFSSHCPVPFENKWSMKQERLAAYLQEINHLQQEYSDKIELYAGLEVDFFPHDSLFHTPPPTKAEVDYYVGSVHYVDKNQFDQPWEIDGSSVEFLACLDSLYQGDIKPVIQRYYAIIREMVLTQKPPIVGHLDKIKMHNAVRFLFDESEEWYQAEIENTLQTIADAGVIVEINTRGHYKRDLDLYPSPWIIKRMYQLDIPICINSDSHRPEEITASFAQAHQAAYEAGYRKKMILLAHQWRAVEL